MMNIELLKEQIAQVINPVSGKTLQDESRIQSVNINNDELLVEYKRDGIELKDKKILESEILSKLDKHIDTNKVILKSISAQKEKVKPSGVPNPAGMAAKKRMNGVKKIIAIGSGKGGVGKSTLTVNLAMTLKNAGKKVGIIDADIYGPSIPMTLGMMGAQPLANDDNKMLPLEAHGIKFISFGLFIDTEAPVIWRGPMLGKVLNQFFFDVEWGELDVILIDLPPGTGDVQLSMVQKIETDGAIIVSTPQDLAFLDARRALEMFKKMELPVLGIVENMSSFICDGCDKEHFIFGNSSLKKTSESLDIKFLGSIPMKHSIASAGDSGTPVMAEKNLDKSISDSYELVVKSLLEKINI